LNFVATFALFGYPLLALIFFALMPASRAVLVTYVLGWLFLPQAGFVLGGVPDYDKPAAIGVGALLGAMVFSPTQLFVVRWRWFDAPIAIFCLWPMATHLANDHGFATGMNWVVADSFLWGIPYLMGRAYCCSKDQIEELAFAIFYGGLVYVPFCWFEIRFSPKLHLMIYGFFQHNFLQHIRYSGFRPIVFMQHGIMVGVWMACSTLVGIWLWRTKLFTKLFGIRAVWWIVLMLVTTVFCKAGSGMAALVLGLAIFIGCRGGLPAISLAILAFIPITYLGMRATGMWEGESLATFIESIDRERGGSLAARMRQEGVYLDQAYKSPIFGFGDGDFIPKDAEGKRLVRGNDGFWIITTGMYGLVSLICAFTALTLPALLVAYNSMTIPKKEQSVLIPLAVVITLFAIDCLFNAMINPLYLLCAGAVSTGVLLSRDEWY
jgi:hypothetical protein